MTAVIVNKETISYISQGHLTTVLSIFLSFLVIFHALFLSNNFEPKYDNQFSDWQFSQMGRSEAKLGSLELS